MGASLRDRAATPSEPSPTVSGIADIPSAALGRFVKESNRIEGINRTTMAHIRAHSEFLAWPITPNSLIVLVAILQPNARFRNSPDIPGVRVGNHIAPPSGPHIADELRCVLAIRDPWEQHIAYETLHPFTDGNGRSGRALWLHRHVNEGFDPWAAQRGFLHSFYYHTLSNVRIAQAIEARRATTTEIGVVEDESAVANGDAPEQGQPSGTSTENGDG
jgi:hypothetical protein